MLSILALGMLVAIGSAFDQDNGGFSFRDGNNHDFGDRNDHDFGDRNDHDFGDGHKDNKYHDWLNPGGIHSYSWWYPSYYKYSWYPYSYSYYPTYTYYTKPVYTTYYDPVVYDPWYATNVYGYTGKTYYTNSWSWSHYGGFYF